MVSFIIISSPKSNGLVLDFRCFYCIVKCACFEQCHLKSNSIFYFKAIYLKYVIFLLSPSYLIFMFCLSGRSISKRTGLIHLVLCDNLDKAWIRTCWKATVLFPSWKHIINLYFNCPNKGSLVTWYITLANNSHMALTYQYL